VTIFHDELNQVPGHFATCRADSGKPLGVVGPGYQIIRNRDAFTFFDSMQMGRESVVKRPERSGTGSGFLSPPKSRITSLSERTI